MRVEPQFDRGQFPITSPDGRSVSIPVRFDPTTECFPGLDDPLRMRTFFHQEGYFVARGLVPPEACDAVVEAFTSEVKPSREYFLRHASGKPERHVFTEHGHMLYPIMNVQDLRRRPYGRFQDAGLQVLAHEGVKRTMDILLGEAGKMIHTMFFDGNQVTWAHQDSYYIDSEEIGRMIGVWVALEDIQPGAGRFYVYPRSHRLRMPRLGVDADFDPNGGDYKSKVIAMIREHGLELYAPALRRGDALFWMSTTIHGSLETTQPQFSRKCLTAHYIPDAQGLRVFHTQKTPLRMRAINGVQVHTFADQNLLKNRAKFFLQARYPGVLPALRKLRGK